MVSYIANRFGRFLTKHDTSILVQTIVNPMGRYEQGKTERLTNEELLDICYEANQIETLEFLLGKCGIDIKELLSRYQESVFRVGSQSTDVKQISDMYKKLKKARKRFGELAEEPPSCIVGETPRLSKEEQLRIRVKRFRK